MGVFDSIIGYESHDSMSNPNYTRSYGTTIEPHTHTGILATYQLLDTVGVAAGIANTMTPQINSRSPRAESHKTYMTSAAITVPDSAGFLAGSTIYAGVVEGFAGDPANDQSNWYLGATLNTPVTGVKVGASFDYVDDMSVLSPAGAVLVSGATAHTFAGYVSFQATEKLSLHARAEFADNLPFVAARSDIFAATGTVQYDLWRNVLSRVEIRWDHAASGDDLFGGSTPGSPNRRNEYLLAANLIYKF